MSYESPITLFTTEVERKLTEELDATVFKAVWKCFPYVDRDELLKALEYDRGQYEAGYADGRAARDAEIVRCGECKHYLGSNEKCALIDTRLHFYETGNAWASDCYCAWGEEEK